MTTLLHIVPYNFDVALMGLLRSDIHSYSTHYICTKITAVQYFALVFIHVLDVIIMQH